MNKNRTHRAKVAIGNIAGSPPVFFEKLIEKAYEELNEEAIKEGMVIINQVVSVSGIGNEMVCYIIVAHWVPRADLELAQTRNNLMGRTPLGGTN